MLKNLPTLIDPKRLALHGAHLKGQVALAEMSRLHENLCEIRGDVHIDWLFATDEQNRTTIQGKVQTQLFLQCQRCLQPMSYPIDAKVALMVVTEKQKNDLPAGYEALTLTSTPISLITLIEDELILALPIVAMHTTCPSNEYKPQNIENNTFQNNPFQILSKLKTH